MISRISILWVLWIMMYKNHIWFILVIYVTRIGFCVILMNDLFGGLRWLHKNEILEQRNFQDRRKKPCWREECKSIFFFQFKIECYASVFDLLSHFLHSSVLWILLFTLMWNWDYFHLISGHEIKRKVIYLLWKSGEPLNWGSVCQKMLMAFQ